MTVTCPGCPLRRLKTFRPLGEPQLVFLNDVKRGERRLEAGSTLIHEGAATREFYTLLEGMAFRYATLSDGRRQILNILMPGDLVGLQERLDGQSPHGVEMLTEGQVCAFPLEALWAIFREQPELAYDVTWLASHEERMVDGNLLSVGRRSAAERVAMLLVHLYKRCEALGWRDEDGSVPFPLTQQHIADALGLSLVHTNKTLRRLRAMGFCELQEGRLRLVQLSALQRVADYYDEPVAPRPLL